MYNQACFDVGKSLIFYVAHRWPLREAVIGRSWSPRYVWHLANGVVHRRERWAESSLHGRCGFVARVERGCIGDRSQRDDCRMGVFVNVLGG